MMVQENIQKRLMVFPSIGLMTLIVMCWSLASLVGAQADEYSHTNSPFDWTVNVKSTDSESLSGIFKGHDVATVFERGAILNQKLGVKCRLVFKKSLHSLPGSPFLGSYSEDIDIICSIDDLEVSRDDVGCNYNSRIPEASADVGTLSFFKVLDNLSIHAICSTKESLLKKERNNG